MPGIVNVTKAAPEVALPTDLMLDTSLVCIHCAIYKEFPKCIGCNGMGECLCMKSANTCYLNTHKRWNANDSSGYCFDFEKDLMGDDGCQYSASKVDFCFLCSSASASECRMPKTFVACAMQQLCIYQACALPFTEELPMKIACCGKVFVGGGGSSKVSPAADMER